MTYYPVCWEVRALHKHRRYLMKPSLSEKLARFKPGVLRRPAFAAL